MSISPNLNTKDNQSLIEAATVPGQPCRAVCGPDGGPVQVITASAVTAFTPGSIATDVAAGPTATAISGSSLKVIKATIIARINNSTSISIGNSVSQNCVLEQGRDITVEDIDLAAVFIFGVAADGVTVFYTT